MNWCALRALPRARREFDLPRRPGEGMTCERQPEEVTFEAPPIVGLLRVWPPNFRFRRG